MKIRLVFAAVIAVALTVAGCSSDSSEPDDVANDFMAAYNSGDTEAAIALFAPGATFSSSFYSAYSRERIEKDIIWAAAQGTTYVEPDCALEDAETSPPQDEDHPTVVIVCETANLNAPSEAIGGPAVPVVMTFVVSADGIESIGYRYGSPDFRFVGDPFEAWVRKHHPDDSGIIGHSEWDLADDARRSGLLNAKYATEWADYLKANGCTFPDACWRQLR